MQFRFPHRRFDVIATAVSVAVLHAGSPLPTQPIWIAPNEPFCLVPLGNARCEGRLSPFLARDVFRQPGQDEPFGPSTRIIPRKAEKVNTFLAEFYRNFTGILSVFKQLGICFRVAPGTSGSRHRRISRVRRRTRGAEQRLGRRRCGKHPEAG